MLVLAIYFAFKPRLALTLFLLGLPVVCEAALWVARSDTARRRLALALALALAVPSALAFDPDARRGAIETMAAERQRLVRFLDKRFPLDAPVAMPTAWHVGVETDRPMYGMRVTIKHQDTPALVRMLVELGVVAAATNNRQSEAVDYAKAMSQLYDRHVVIGRWSVFFNVD